MKKRLFWGTVIAFLIVGAFIWKYYEARPTVSLLDPPHGLMPAKGDGTDETEVIQAIFDYATSNHKTVLIPEGYTFVVDRITIYRKQHFSLQGSGTLKHKDNATGPLLEIIACRNFEIIELNTDGNVAGNETKPWGRLDATQELHSVEIAWCNDFKVGTITDINPAADSLYLNDVVNGRIEALNALADEPCGRNGLSIIKGEKIFLGQVNVQNIGVEGMPGGIDLEPNDSEDDIRNVIIEAAQVKIAHGAGIAVTSQWGSEIVDIEINGEVTKTGGGSYVFMLDNVKNFRGKLRLVQLGIPTSYGARISRCENVTADLDISNAINGIDLGVGSSNIHLTGKINGTTGDGISIWEGLKDSTINMEIKMAGRDGKHGVIHISKYGTVDNLVFMGNYSYSGTGRYCFRIDGLATNCRVEDLETAGWNKRNLVIGSNSDSLRL